MKVMRRKIHPLFSQERKVEKRQAKSVSGWRYKVKGIKRGKRCVFICAETERS